MAIDLCASRPDLCCGCGACAGVCPKKAISMEYSSDGFLYPYIDAKKCVECGLCLKICDFKHFKPTGKEPRCYAVRHKNIDELNTSRSGGFFMVLCEYVIENQGVVFGCELDGELCVVHSGREIYEDCKRFKGSKYVQSDLKSTFEECAQFLQNGRSVLFSGTGCQVHGLLSYLSAMKVQTDRLTTVDIVCHGTPSPGVWGHYIRAFEQKEKSRIASVDFRDKTAFGWRDHVEKYVLSDGRILHKRNWTDGFYRHIVFRDSCHSCKYTTTERKSDFTIADYWGIKKNVPEFDDNKGCSLVLIHTSKGNTLFDCIHEKIDYQKTELATSMQPQLSRPIWRGWDRGLFWRVYKMKPQLAIKKWFFPSKVTKLIWKVERKGKTFLKKLLQR